MKNINADQVHPKQMDIFDFIGADIELKYKVIAYDVPFSYCLPLNAPVDEAFFETHADAHKYAMLNKNLDYEIHHTEWGLLTTLHF